MPADDTYLRAKVTGFKELQADLAEFQEKMQRKIVAAAVRDGARVVLKSAKSEAPIAKKAHYAYPKKGGGRVLIQPGLIRRSVGMARAKAKRGMTVYNVGPMRKKGKGPENDPFYWKFVEFGVPAHGIPPHPFLRSAFNKNQRNVINAIREGLKKGIQKQIGRMRVSRATA